MLCKKCNRGTLIRRGYNLSKKGRTPRFQCNYCGDWPLTKDIQEAVTIPVNKKRKMPKVVVVDVETLPATGYFWGLFDQNIGLNQIIQDGCLLSWAGKVLNESGVEGNILTPEEAINRDAKRITIGLWEYLKDAQIVIGHNFDAFDRKVINTAFLEYGLPPLKYRVIDTLITAKANMRFISNKLEYINKKLGIRTKISNEGFNLWRGCAEGNEESLYTMMEYNFGDILATEELYHRIKAWVPNHPALTLYGDVINEYRCPVCTSLSVHTEGIYPSTGKSLYESVRCENCGALSKLNVNLLSKEQRKFILR